MAEFEVEAGDDAGAVPTRVLFVQAEARPPVELVEEDYVMAFPHLILREAICFLSVFLFLSLLAIYSPAPLEAIANPELTPNPAKAPWYFLGLQELLHYYPPLISGIILPGVVVVGLVIIPYFDVNLRRDPMWETQRGVKFAAVWLAALGVVGLLELTAPHPVLSVEIPTLALAFLMTLPVWFPSRGPVMTWLETRSLPFWIFTWFVVVAVVLTVIGVFFRGPGWAFTLPWRDGLYL